METQARHLHVEIGMGRGAFLAQFAKAHPKDLCIGIERASAWFKYAQEHIVALGLSNVELLNIPAEDFLTQQTTKPCVSNYFVLFPDPWPKKDQRRRRVLCPRNIKRFWHTLLPHGQVTFATDHLDYFKAIEKLMATEFPLSFTREQLSALPFKTHYQQKYERQGRPLYFVRWTKTAFPPGLIRSNPIDLAFAKSISAH